MKTIELDDKTLIEYNDVSIIVSQPTGSGAIAIGYASLGDLIAVLRGINDTRTVSQQEEADGRRSTAWNGAK